MLLQGTITQYNNTARPGIIYRGDAMYDDPGVCGKAWRRRARSPLQSLEHKTDISEAGGGGAKYARASEGTDPGSSPELSNNREGGGGGVQNWSLDLGARSIHPPARVKLQHLHPHSALFVHPIGNRCNRKHVNLEPNNRGWI